MDTTFEIAAGFDDNPAEVSKAEGSGMVRYRAQLEQSVWMKETGSGLDIYLDTIYSQYFDVDDNYLLRAGGELSSALWKDRIQAGLFGEVAVYRDDLVMEDEYNTLLIGGSLQWLADVRLTVSLEGAYSRVDYQNPVSFPGQRSYAVGMGRGKSPGGRNQTVPNEWITYAQKDSSWYMGMTATYAMGPDVQADLTLLYRDLESSADYESYQEIGGVSRLVWFGPDSLEVFVSAYWSERDYDVSPESDVRSDDVYGFGLGGSRYLGSMQLFIQFDQSATDSPISGENYQKSVILCGASYSF